MNVLTPRPEWPARLTTPVLPLRAWLALLLVGLSGHTLAQDTKTIGYIGLGGIHEPAFAGAGERRTRAIPLLDVRTRHFLFNTTRGMPELGVRIAPGQALELAAIASVDRGRKASDSPMLSALEANDIDPFPSVGMVASWRTNFGPAPFEVLLRPMRRLGDSDGWTADLRLALGLAELGAFSAQAHMQTTWATRRAQQLDFGLPSTLENPDAAAFEPGSGLRETRFGVSANYMLSKRYRLLLQMERRRLGSDPARSAVLERRSDTAFALGFAYSL